MIYSNFTIEEFGHLDVTFSASNSHSSRYEVTELFIYLNGIAFIAIGCG